MKGYYEILVAAHASRAIRSFDPMVARYVVDSLEYLSTDRESGNVRTVDKETGLVKVEMGDFDALCWVRDEEMRIIVLAVSQHGHPA
ncbi:hypothetical protein [Spirillospora sp. NPDC047279]|uniref:type II toxin-antitoxin system RelE family toxin n=1 Tax=Spirillospora sp. NPDC047279 TaxID=3155478 RepID=UPI0033C5B1B0